MRNTLIFLNIVALIGSLVWLKNENNLEPLITTITLIVTLIPQIVKNKPNLDKTTMSQKGGKKSNNYQSKGDINIKHD